jgi:Ca2+-binding RTX toxin-like protein
VRKRALALIALAVVPTAFSVAEASAASAPAPNPSITCDGKTAAQWRQVPGKNVIIGTDGRNIKDGTAGDDVMFGYEGNDELRGLGGNDIICGNGGEDTLNGGGGDDRIFGGQGYDYVVGNHDGNDFIDGGDDSAQLSYRASNDAVVLAYRNTIGFSVQETKRGKFTDTFVNFGVFEGTAKQDTLDVRDSTSQLVYGAGAHDVIILDSSDAANGGSGSNNTCHWLVKKPHVSNCTLVEK